MPILDIPIQIPVAVRTGSDYGLRFTVPNSPRSTPLAAADLTFWGFPAAADPHIRSAFPKARPANPAGCPELADTELHRGPTEASIPIRPLIDNPTICTGAAAARRP